MRLISPSLRVGPLAPYADGFARDLVGRGYTVNGAAQYLRFVAHLNRWMLTRGLDIAGLSVSVIEQFLGERRARGYVRYRSVKAMQPLLRYLTPLRVLPEVGVPKRGRRKIYWSVTAGSWFSNVGWPRVRLTVTRTPFGRLWSAGWVHRVWIWRV